MNGRLAGKAALITGAAGGIGAACARLFASEGARLLLMDREPGAPALDGAQAFPGDVSKPEDMEAAIRAAVEAFGGLDAAILNAGIEGAVAPTADYGVEAFDRVIAVNLRGVFLGLKYAIPALRARGGGSIVNVSSVFGVAGRAGMGQYDVTKAAVVSLSRTLAIEEVDHGIRVNTVCPGPTLTPFHVRRAEAQGVTEEELRRTGAGHSLMKRWAEPREIACAILFLAGNESSYVTGTTLVVDGGVSASVGS